MIYNNLVLSLQRATTIRKEILAREMAHSNRFTGTWTSTCQWISVSLHCKNSMQKWPEARERLYLPTHGSDYFEIGSAKQVATAGARTEERRRASATRVKPASLSTKIATTKRLRTSTGGLSITHCCRTQCNCIKHASTRISWCQTNI